MRPLRHGARPAAYAGLDRRRHPVRAVRDRPDRVTAAQAAGKPGIEDEEQRGFPRSTYTPVCCWPAKAREGSALGSAMRAADRAVGAVAHGRPWAKQARLACQTPDRSSPVNMTFSIAPVVALIAGILILAMPRLLNYIVAIYLIVTGLLGLFGSGSFHVR